MVGWLKFNIIEKIPFMVHLEIQCITFKTETSFIAHPWIKLSVVGLEVYSAHDWRAATSLQRAPVTWREWGLWFYLSPSGFLQWHWGGWSYVFFFVCEATSKDIYVYDELQADIFFWSYCGTLSVKNSWSTEVRSGTSWYISWSWVCMVKSQLWWDISCLKFVLYFSRTIHL